MNSSKPIIIASEADIEAGVDALVDQCQFMKQVFQVTGLPPLRRDSGGFEGLARIIVGQQLSVASANAIWLRFKQGFKVVEVSSVDDRTDEELKDCGLSRPKIRTLRALCEAIGKGLVDIQAMEQMDTEDVAAQLVQVHGIGPWTADIYNMFCLGHGDAWAPGDLALQYAVQDILNIVERPKEKEMVEHAERWRPWRGVAARLLWAYYSVVKERKSGIPV